MKFMRSHEIQRTIAESGRQRHISYESREELYPDLHRDGYSRFAPRHARFP